VFQPEVVAEIPTSTGEALKGGQWSPDMQLLVLASNEKLYALSRDFDIVSEQDLRPLQPGKGNIELKFGLRHHSFVLQSSCKLSDGAQEKLNFKDRLVGKIVRKSMSTRSPYLLMKAMMAVVCWYHGVQVGVVFALAYTQ
jgi:hypothetical protein